MKKWLKEHVGPHLARPIVYKVLSYFPTALVLILLWKRFVDRAGLFPIHYAYTIAGVFFLAVAWFSYLRIDGVKMPSTRHLRRGNAPMPKKRPPSPYADMTDYIDIEVISFEELTHEERAICSLVASVICSVIYFVLSLL